MKKTTFKKKLALILGIIMLIGLLPLHAAAVVDGVSVAGVKDDTGVTATLKNASPGSVNALILLAVYEPNGKLNFIEVSNVTAAAGASVNQRFDFNVLANRAYTYKLFAWDPDTYVPLCEDATPTPDLCVIVDGTVVEFDGIFVDAGPEVTEFMYVRIDGAKRIGVAFTAKKADGVWTHTKVIGADVIIAYRPSSIIGGTLPAVRLTQLDTRVSNHVNKIRIVISL